MTARPLIPDAYIESVTRTGRTVADAIRQYTHAQQLEELWSAHRAAEMDTTDTTEER